jgi:diadenylate cyclase
MTKELLERIKLISPGTLLRKALDDILRAQMGALVIMVEDLERYTEAIQGGFILNIPFTPEYLYELAKMDGAIVISEDATKIFAANVHLVPNSSIPTRETGTRHRTAERFAKQFEKVAIAVSRRRNIITLYYKDYRYVVNDLNFVISKVNQAINTLEKYRKNFDRLLIELDAMELENRTTIYDVSKVMQKGIMVLRIAHELKPFLVELGDEGRLAKMQIEELTENARDLVELILMDYSSEDLSQDKVSKIVDNLVKSPSVDLVKIARSLGYKVQQTSQLDDISVEARGYRLLKYIAKIPMSISKKVVEKFKGIFEISRAGIDDLKSVEGIGDKRAKAIVDNINSLKMRKNLLVEEEIE